MDNKVPGEINVEDTLEQAKAPTGESPHPGHRKLLERLYLLAELKPGKTLSDKSLTVIDHTKFNSWYRWWYDEGRIKSTDLVYTIIDEAKNYLETSTEEEPFEEKKTVIAALLCARSGIETLLETYYDDARIKARVKTITAEIQTMIRHHQAPIIPIWPRFNPTLGGLVGLTQQQSPVNHKKQQPVITNTSYPTSLKKQETQENLNID